MPTETPTRPIDAALAAWVQDEKRVQETLILAQGMADDQPPTTATQVLQRLLAWISHRDAQLAAAEEKLDLAVATIASFVSDVEAAESQLAAVRAMAGRLRNPQPYDPDVPHQTMMAVRWQRIAIADALDEALADPPRVADRLTPEQRTLVEQWKPTMADWLVEILDQHCPRPELEGETT